MVKGALFARYSRSPKSLRRLLLDEFLPPDERDARGAGAGAVGEARAEALYERVLAEYGDDSVAQLGGAHIAVEGASNLLTKVLQWGRLASYLEQSTRYIPYTDRPGGRYRYHRPAAVMAHPELGPAYAATLDGAFDGYAALLPRLVEHVGARVPPTTAAPDGGARPGGARRGPSTCCAGCCRRPRRRTSGIFASGQAYEAMLIRMGAHPLPEARECAAAMLARAAQGHPGLPDPRRPPGPGRGPRRATCARASARRPPSSPRGLLRRPARPAPDGPAVRLVDFDPDGEARVLAHALWPASGRDPRPRCGSAWRRSSRGRARRRRSRRGPAAAATGASARAGRSRPRPTRSRSSATTAPTATSSATAC